MKLDFWTPRNLARFWDGFVWDGEHLLWTRCTNGRGYGTFFVWGLSERVHRIALELYLRRPIAPGMYALHTRDCPFRNCARFEHLYEGTHWDNMCDMRAAKHTTYYDYVSPYRHWRW